MATKKFIIEVEEGKTKCGECPIYIKCYRANLSELDCNKYNLATMKITEYNEPTCYDMQCLGRNPHKKEEEK